MESETIDYSINMMSFRGIPFFKYANNFTFIVNKKRYQTNRAVADILSPIVRNFHYTDESIDEFSFDINEDTELFSEFLLLPSLNNTKLNSKQKEVFAKYFLKLGNYVEYFILRLDNDESITRDNFLEHIQTFSKHSGMISQGTYNEIMSIFSENFNTFAKFDDFELLDIDTIEDIISNESLKLKDEDILLNLILDLYEKDHQFSRLFDYVIFSNVSKESLERFFETFSIDDINNEIWRNILSVILHKDTIPVKKTNYLNIKEKDKKQSPKVVFIGHTQCGKTCIIDRYYSNKIQDFLPTVLNTIRDIDVELSDTDVNLSIYDTSGQERFRSITAISTRNADFIVFVYDPCNLASFAIKDELIQMAMENSNPKVFIVCNKIDLITYLPNNLIEEGRRYAEEHNYQFLETSARTGQNIKELFNQIAQKFISS